MPGSPSYCLTLHGSVKAVFGGPGEAAVFQGGVIFSASTLEAIVNAERDAPINPSLCSVKNAEIFVAVTAFCHACLFTTGPIVRGLNKTNRPVYIWLRR